MAFQFLNKLANLTSVNKPSTNSLPVTVKTGKVAGAQGSVPTLPPERLLEGVNEMVRNVTDYLTVAEQETTKRAAIAARKEVAIESIRAQRETISELLRYTFDERAQVIRKQFEALDRALETGNVAVADSALKGMVSVIQSSPFKSIQEMQAAMGNKDFVIRLE
jgi:hypothetical protein